MLAHVDALRAKFPQIEIYQTERNPRGYYPVYFTRDCEGARLTLFLPEFSGDSNPSGRCVAVTREEPPALVSAFNRISAESLGRC